MEDQTDKRVVKAPKKPMESKPVQTPSKKKSAWGTWALVIFLVVAIGLALWLLVFDGYGLPSGFQPFVAQTEETEEEEEVSIYRVIDGKLPKDGDLSPQPFAVMVENMTVVRPQAGLSFAPVVYETLAEGGITRFMAVFTDEEVEKIGPVRSARPYYLEWSSEFDAIYCHAGGSPQALEAISGLGIDSLNAISGEGRFFYRDSSLAAPHNLFTDSELLNLAIRDKELEDKVVDFNGWQFADLEHETGYTEIENVTIQFSTPAYASKYVYDLEENVYLRYNGGVAHTDALTGEQIQVKNVVIQQVPPETSAGEKGRISLDVTGEGTAIVLRNGEVVRGSWEKADRESRTYFYDENGEEIVFARGNTWVHVIPNDRPIEFGMN